MRGPRFNNKVVIITGGGSGLGQAYCLAFAEEGASVVCPDVNLDSAERTAARIREMGGNALAVQTDVSKADEVKRMVAHAIEAYGRIDILVNNAGIVSRVGLLDTTEELWDRETGVDLKGTFLVTRAVAPHMILGGGGKIVNISSVLGLIGVVSPAYTASKAGVIGLTRQWAMEFAPHHICVNCVVPGYIATPISERVRDTVVVEKIGKQIPFGWGSVDGVVPTVLFLSSSESDYITGQSIVVDGGLTACRDFGPEYRGFDGKKP
jgi:3-oxoacyl-[acyl-carrier protein] reductase